MPTFATFHPPKTGGTLPTRIDTRVYLKTPTPLYPSPHCCVGTVYMLNPGSAKLGTTSACSITDPTLEGIERIFRHAMTKKYPLGHKYQDPFLEILNLSYYANSKPINMWHEFFSCGPTAAQCISPNSRFIWIAWGNNADAFQGPLIPAIIAIKKSKKPAFCYDGKHRKVVQWDSSVTFPVHPAPRNYKRYSNFRPEIESEMMMNL